MKFILCLICFAALLTITGCIIVPDRDHDEHWEHHDNGWHGDHDGDHR